MIKPPQAELSNDGIPAFDTHTFNSVDVMSGSQLPHPAIPNNTTKEQVENVVKGRKSRDPALAKSLLDAFSNLVDPDGRSGAKSMLSGVSTAVPNLYLDRAAEFIPRAPWVC